MDFASTFASLFIWGFSKMSFPDGNSGIVIFMEQVLENIEYAIMGNEGIVFPTVAVLVIMVLINAFMLRFRIPQRRILGSGF